MSIFKKDLFTLKELCNMFIAKYNSDISPELYAIIQCYLNFSSGNTNYRKFLNKTRMNKGSIYISEIKTLHFREILQAFDIEFCKLVITIHTQPKNYDIIISWKDFEITTKNITKDDLEKLIC